jgi:general stress protein YciG
MTPERRRELGKEGGKVAHENGRAHRFTRESASEAGKIPHERGTAHHWDAEEARQAGKKGGNTPKRTRNPNGDSASGPNDSPGNRDSVRSDPTRATERATGEAE